MSYLDIARQAALPTEGEGTATKATKATKAPLRSLRSLMSQPCGDEIELQARCKIACDGLPILPMALFASLDVRDRAAQYSGGEGQTVLRAYAEAIASRLEADDRQARETPTTEAAVFRYTLAWNPEQTHSLILPAGSTLDRAHSILKRKHGPALLWTEVHKPGVAWEGTR